MFKEIYLDDAATSRYKPACVLRAVRVHLKRAANPGRSGHDSALCAASVVEECRATICDLLGEGNVVFTKNCTEALNLALFGSNLHGVVLTSVFEHNSVLRPLHELEKRGAITPVYAAPERGYRLSESDLLGALKGRIPIFLVFSEQSNVTGATQDVELLKRIAARFRTPLLIDTAQSLGHTETNYTGCIVASSGHKGLHGPQGTGFLWLPERYSLSPMLYGGTGTESANPNQPKIFPEGYESGTLNTPGIAGLKEGIRWYKNHWEMIKKKLSRLASLLYEGMTKIEGVKLYSPAKSSVVSFTLKDYDSSEVGNILNEKYHISVRTGLHCAPKTHEYLGTLQCGTVRVSLGVHNTEGDIERFLRALSELSEQKSLS